MLTILTFQVKHFSLERTVQDLIITHSTLFGGVQFMLSLDIANAFNSLPFSCIRVTLHYRGVPGYLRRLVADYLEESTVIY